MFNFITLKGWHINICQVTVFAMDGRTLKIFTADSSEPLCLDDPGRTWYAKLCKAVGIDPVEVLA